MEITAVDCEIEGCGWEAILLPPLEFNQDGFDKTYSYFYEHLIEDHGLNPDKSKPVGFDEASCRIILTEGCGSLIIKTKTKKEFIGDS